MCAFRCGFVHLAEHAYKQSTFPLIALFCKQDEYEQSDWTSSPIFDDDWFGAANPPNANHVVTEGRWAYTRVTVGALETSPRNPYGLLRSPWNTDPTPYVMRSRYVLGEKDGGWKFPGCGAFSAAWNETSLSSYFENLNGFLHGPVHVMIGGHWGLNTSYNVTWTQVLTRVCGCVHACKHVWMCLRHDYRTSWVSLTQL